MLKNTQAQVHKWIPESRFGMVHILPAPQTFQEPQPVPATYTPLYTVSLSSLGAYNNYIAAVPGMFPAGATVKSMCDVDGVSTKTISQALQGMFINLSDFLPNIVIENTASDLQTFLDFDGTLNVLHKHTKRTITCFSSWLEAFTNYEKLIILHSGQGVKLYPEVIKYRQL